MQFDSAAAAQHRQRYSLTQRLPRQQTVQVVEPRHRLAGKSDDKVALFDTRTAGGTVAVNRGNLQRAVARQLMVPNRTPRQRYVLSRESKPRPPHTAVLEQLRNSHFRSVDRGSETDALRRQD